MLVERIRDGESYAETELFNTYVPLIERIIKKNRFFDIVCNEMDGITSRVINDTIKYILSTQRPIVNLGGLVYTITIRRIRRESDRIRTRSRRLPTKPIEDIKLKSGRKNPFEELALKSDLEAIRVCFKVLSHTVDFQIILT